MRLSAAALIAIATLAGAAAAHAQADQKPAPPPAPPPRPPVVIIDPDALRGPPRPPHERQYMPAPDSRAPPMERPSPLPQMTPRVGN